MTTGEIITISGNLLLVVITGVYAYFTFRILQANQRVADEMRLQRRDLLRPIITIGPYVIHGVILALAVKNTGASPAANLRLSVDTDFYTFGEAGEDRNLKTFPMFSESISTFAAGAELHVWLSQGFNLDAEKDGKPLTPKQFGVTAVYEFQEERYDELSHVDLRPYMKTSAFRAPWEDELKKIREALDKIAKNKSI